MRFPNASKNISFVDLFFQNKFFTCWEFSLTLELWHFFVFFAWLGMPRENESSIQIFHGQSKFKAVMKGKTLITTKETKTLAALVVLRLSDLTTWAAESFSRHKRFWTKIKLQIVILSRIWPSYLSRVS